MQAMDGNQEGPDEEVTDPQVGEEERRSDPGDCTPAEKQKLYAFLDAEGVFLLRQ